MNASSHPLLIARPRLADAIELAIDGHGIVAVISPAGYGKSSAIGLALAGLGRPAVRYTAQLWHAGEFAEPLVAEVRRVREDFGRLTLALARRRPREGDTRAAASEGQRLGAAFASDLGHVPTPIVISLEDAHLFEGDAYFASFLTGLVRTLPAHARLILEGRLVPAGVPLAEWIVQGRAAMFGADDLRLDAGDVVRLAERSGKSIDAAGAAALQTRFDGWAAGLALHFAAGARALPSSAGTVDGSTAYLLGAAIETLPSALTAFLESTIVYETLDRSVLEADERHATHVTARFNDLERSGAMFTVVKPLERYRLHPLLREALTTRVRQASGARAIAQMHGEAGRTLEAIGLTAAALFHLQESGDDERLAAFLQRNAYRLFIAGLGERAARLARSLDGKHPFAAGVAAQLSGMLARQRGEAGAAAAFAEALDVARKRDDAVAIAGLKILIVEDAIARGETIAEGDLREIATIGNTFLPGARVDANLFAGWAAALGHDFTRARTSAREAGDLAGDAVVARTRVVSLEAYTSTVLGQFDEAARALDGALHALEGSDHVVLLANTLVWYARFALVWGDVVAAKDFATQGRELAKRLDLQAELAGVDLALAEIAAHEGDAASAEAAVASAHAGGQAAWYFADRDRTEALGTRFVARARFARDGAPAALAHLRSALASESIPKDRRAPLLADAAAFAVLAGEREPVELAAFEAEARETRVADGLDALGLATASRIVGLARAAAGLPQHVDIFPAGIETAYTRLYAARRDLTALADPKAALAASEHTAHLLEERGPSFEARLVRAFAPYASTRQTSPLVAKNAALTPRESEILGLLAQGLTNKEIAQRFTLSPRTVDTHVERVLAKLGVTTRTRAVAAALRSGLIDVARA